MFSFVIIALLLTFSLIYCFIYHPDVHYYLRLDKKDKVLCTNDKLEKTQNQVRVYDVE